MKSAHNKVCGLLFLHRDAAEEAEISTAGTTRTHTKQSRWFNSSTGKRNVCVFAFGVNCPSKKNVWMYSHLITLVCPSLWQLGRLNVYKR